MYKKLMTYTYGLKLKNFTLAYKIK